MRFRTVTLQNFRNLPLAQVRLEGARTFLCGANGQGKSNFLEALGYVTALRSFRGADPRALVALGQTEAAAAYVLDHERFGETRIMLKFGPDGREVEWEQGRVARLGDFIGRFPTVSFSSQDDLLLRGPPSSRRRWLDLTLAAMDAEYLGSLQGYTRSVAERNMLLKQGGRDEASLAAFENEAAGHAVKLIQKRADGAAILGELFARSHAALVPEGEVAGISYAPDVPPVERAEYCALLHRMRPRDLLFKSTVRGPHRDDLELLLSGQPAKSFASEGQQRCLILALRLAQAAYFKNRGGVEPVLLCDDVLGELDPARRQLFWRSLSGAAQVIATGTAAPADSSEWQMLSVSKGAISG